MAYYPYQPSSSVPPRVLERMKVFNTIVEVVHGDITDEQVAAITNAANEDLWLGGGVAGSISKKAGYEVNLACAEYIRTNGKVREGRAMATGAGNLHCMYIIHAVGPTYREGSPNEELLRQTVISVLREAEGLNIESVAIPAISSGIFGYPTHECANVMFTTLGQYLQETPNTCLRQVRFTNIDKATVRRRQVDCFLVRFNMVRSSFAQLDIYLHQIANEPLRGATT